MKKFISLKGLFLLALTFPLFFSCNKDDDNDDLVQQSTSNIVVTAQNTDALSSLVGALTKADENDDSDLIGTLAGDGPFTVFAPTNEAFNTLLASLDGFDSLEDFDTPEEKTLLATILQYHVIAGAAAASTDLSEAQELTTVQGERITVSLDGGVFLDDATETDAEVIIPDVGASNGIVHVISKVLLPQAIIDALNADDMGDETKNLVEIVVEAESLSALEAAVIKAELVETLSGEGPFTVFAPTDHAFTALLDALGDDYNSLDDFDTDEEIALLTDILLYHVIPAKVLAADLDEGEVATALAENKIEIIADGDTFVIGDASDTNANITGTDIMASNGVAHTIDKVLLPQSAIDFVASLQKKNIVEIAQETEDLSVLVEALIAADAGLVETLSGEGPFTVFAPTNDAFVALLGALGDDYNSLADFDTQEEIDLLVDILKYHVVAGAAAFSTDLSDGQMITTVNGSDVTVSIKDGMVHIVDATGDGATVTLPDVEASNGVVHVINKVLLPQSAVDFLAELQLKNIVEIAIETDDLSLLVEALIAADAGLVEALSGEGPFTVFAPTNHAFVELLDVLGDDYNSLADFDTEEEINLLIDILKYHVVAGAAAFSTDLMDGQQIETLQGGSVTIGINGGVSIKDATDDPAHVDLADVEASNGVVHVIDKVLLPQSAVDFVAQLQLKTIVEIAVETDDLSLLVDALVQADAGLVEALGGEGPFTVFAPTNHAFVDLLGILGDEYHGIADFDTAEEKALLVDILTYHVVSGTAAFSTDLMDGQQIETLQGEKVTIGINGGVFIKDATDDTAHVDIPDVTASNGVVHVIDKVLLPQSAIDALTPPVPNIVELAQSVDDLSLLVDALVQADAGLVEVLGGDGPFTVFAPTNQAFADLLYDLGDDYHSLADFDTPAEKELLAKILTYHVVAGAALASGDLKDHQRLHTVQGEDVTVILDHGVFIRDKTHFDAEVIAPNNEASNGIVHLIDKVLLPQEVIDVLH
ncbi:fasciclin domain-containing protein [Allomuricauda sp. SCSIO 65647]|uniref:fasciclin domain-containing protein n=1 Tax=Allomuricauda sp. SCSIO 65647 TaxID=2908843 RepID=UPI001F367FC6|nr:fasciclin domain-containing protein [Muricauda sp. SCSIO 65647]UJH67928.1 fasciclin domain-containing protein [Muricauda sp. SCSIO 65647]